MTIKIYTNVQEMMGVGEEWLVTKDTDQMVLAKFYEGNMAKAEDCIVVTNSAEVTKKGT